MKSFNEWRQLKEQYKRKEQYDMGFLKKETTIAWGRQNKYRAVFPAGTRCVLATNWPRFSVMSGPTPRDSEGKLSYWIDGDPSSLSGGTEEDFKGWKNTYGFMVAPDEVVSSGGDWYARGQPRAPKRGPSALAKPGSGPPRSPESVFDRYYGR